MNEKEKLLKRLNKYKWEMLNGCWRWISTISSSGTAQTKFKGKMIPVPRLVMWIFHDFDINSKLYILHKTKDGTCEHKDCWNPEHLYVGTHAQNMADKTGSRSHCKYGHELTPENTRVARGYSVCIACCRERGNRYYRRKTQRQVQLGKTVKDSET